MLYILLEINLTRLKNKQKGQFFAKVRNLMSSEDFEPFRKAIDKSAVVYSASEIEYDKLLILRKIIGLLNEFTAAFSIFQQMNERLIPISLTDFEHIIERFKNVCELPSFKYYPNVYESGSLSFYINKCEVCNKDSFCFQEGCYGESGIEVICVHCITSGKAGKEHDIFFNNQYPITFLDDNKIEEINLRTPSILSWQEISWLEHCNDFCAYIGNFNWVEILHLEEELQNDLTLEAAEYDLEIADFKNALNTYIFGHLFQCLHCGKHRLTTDLP